MRNIKTAISVVICIVISNLLNLNNPIFVIIGAIVSMQGSINESYQSGINRILGTVFGAMVGMLFYQISPNNTLLIGLGTILKIHINNKLKWNKKQLIKIDTWNVKASQYNHFDDNYVKKELGERWNDFGEFKIQRDLYSAFLIMNVKDSLKEVDREKCFIGFDNFKILHDEEITRLRNSKRNIASMGI